MWSRCFPSNVKELFSFRIPSPVLNTSEGCLHKNHFRTESSCWPLLPLGILWYAPATLALCSLFPKELYCHCSNIRGARLESCCWPSPPVGSLWPALENTGSPGFPSHGTAVIRGSECCSNCWCELRVANGICRPDKLFCPGTLLFATTDNFDSGCAHFLASGESGPLPLLQLHRRHRVELSNRDAKGKRHHELVVVTLLSVGAVSKLFGILGLEEGKNGKVRRDWIAPGCAQAASGRWCPALSFCSRTLLGGILEISNWQVDSPDCRSMRPYIQIAGRVHSSSACDALIGTEEKGQSSNSFFTGAFFCVSCSRFISCIHRAIPKAKLCLFGSLKYLPWGNICPGPLGQSQWDDSAICSQSGSLQLPAQSLLGSPCHPRNTEDSCPCVSWWHQGTLCTSGS